MTINQEMSGKNNKEHSGGYNVTVGRALPLKRPDCCKNRFSFCN